MYYKISSYLPTRNLHQEVRTDYVYTRGVTQPVNSLPSQASGMQRTRRSAQLALCASADRGYTIYPKCLHGKMIITIRTSVELRSPVSYRSSLRNECMDASGQISLGRNHTDAVDVMT